MRVDNIVKQVASLLAKEDLSEYLEGGTSVDISQTKRDKQLIIDCLNNLLCELCGTLVKLKAEEEMESKDKRIYYKDFPQRLLGILSVTDLKGNKVKFDLFPTYIRLYDDKKVNVLYNYLPQRVDYDDEITVGSTRVTEQILAYGTLAEYCLAVALYEEAVTWRQKFEKSLSNALYNQSYRIKGRVFK